jgi:AraC-like DNA-binding protein
VTDLKISPYFPSSEQLLCARLYQIKRRKKEGTMSELDGTDQRLFDYYPRLKRLREYIEQNYSEPISLEKAAGIAALESSYFSSYFRAKVGITFTGWLRQIRVKKAMELMKSRDFSITEVAYEVGFADLTTFGRAFKRYALKTPREFKKSVLPA